MKRAYQILTVYTLSLFAPMWAYAADVSNDAPPPEPTPDTPPVAPPEPETDFDITQNQQRKTTNQQPESIPKTTQSDGSKRLRLSKDELAKQPELLYRALSSSILLRNVEGVRTLLPIYQEQTQQPKDELLIDLSEGMIARDDGNAGKAAKHYQKALEKNPNMDLVRLNLAQVLFEDHQNRESDKLFEQIQSEPELPNNVRDLTQSYRKILKKRSRMNAYAHANYTRNHNVNNSPKERVIHTRNGAWYLPEPESAQGISYRAGVGKDTPLFKNYTFRTNADLWGKFYWDNHKYDDLSTRASVGVAYQNARSEMAVLPYYERRWFGTEKYATEKGIRLESSHWITPRHQALVAAEVGRDTYDTRKFLNGRVSNLSVTWLHTPSNQQYFTLGTDFSRKSAQDSSDSYHRQGIRASWSRSWKRSGLGTTLTTNYGQREYDTNDFFNIVRKDKEYSATLSVWHKKVQLWGITPRLVGVYYRNDSNHFMYDYRKAYAFIQLSKSL